MYLTFYYLGGATGSFVPSVIYEHFGWDIMLYSFVFILCIEENKKNKIQDRFEKLSKYSLNKLLEEHKLSTSMIKDMVENGL